MLQSDISESLNLPKRSWLFPSGTTSWYITKRNDVVINITYLASTKRYSVKVKHMILCRRPGKFESTTWHVDINVHANFNIHVFDIDEWMNQAYSRLSTTHGHITDCKLVCMYWTRFVLVRPAVSLYSASPLKHHPTGKQWWIWMGLSPWADLLLIGREKSKCDFWRYSKQSNFQCGSLMCL